jgi:hypothetical protein
MADPRIVELAKSLSKAQREALMALPLPGWKAHRVFMGCGHNVSYSSTWRKLTHYRPSLAALQSRGIVESKVSRAETLWRLTKPDGIALRKHLQDTDHA